MTILYQGNGVGLGNDIGGCQALREGGAEVAGFGCGPIGAL
jgi:hypothetical protein